MFNAHDLQLLMMCVLFNKKKKKKNHAMFLRENFHVNSVCIFFSHEIHVRHNWLCTVWHLTSRIHIVLIRPWNNGVLCCITRNFSMDRYVLIYLTHKEQSQLEDKYNQCYIIEKTNLRLKETVRSSINAFIYTRSQS